VEKPSYKLLGREIVSQPESELPAVLKKGGKCAKKKIMWGVNEVSPEKKGIENEEGEEPRNVKAITRKKVLLQKGAMFNRRRKGYRKQDKRRDALGGKGKI